MKTILVLTDFSKSAVHASQIAARLAQKTHAGILLWNRYLKVPILPGYIGGTTLARTVAGIGESRGKLQLAAENLQDFITSSDEKYRPSLNTLFKEGTMKETLLTTLAEQHFEMIVMGASTDCLAEHVFTGSDTQLVIENANCPVLIVPPRATMEELDKIVFATNFDPTDLFAISYLHKLRIDLDFRIEIVHITINGEKDAAMIEKEAAFNRQLVDLKAGKILYREIRGKEAVNRLNRISKQTRADVLSMTHHQYSFFRRLFSDSVAKQELSHQKIPLLVFPVAMNAS